MQARTLSGAVAAIAGLISIHANAAALPTLELQDGLVASVPITTGSISFGGITLTGAPLVGSPSQPVLQLAGTVTGNAFNPVTIKVTEYNLTPAFGVASLLASIGGTLAPLSSVSWSAYLDSGNTPFGTGQLIASNSFANPTTNAPIGFFDPLTSLGSLSGPFSLTEVITAAIPVGQSISFNSSITATVPTPEPSSMAVLGVGLLGLGMLAPARRLRATRAA